VDALGDLDPVSGVELAHEAGEVGLDGAQGSISSPAMLTSPVVSTARIRATSNAMTVPERHHDGGQGVGAPPQQRRGDHQADGEHERPPRPVLAERQLDR
jgi:hypothetical protein